MKFCSNPPSVLTLVGLTFVTAAADWDELEILGLHDVKKQEENHYQGESVKFRKMICNMWHHPLPKGAPILEEVQKALTRWGRGDQNNWLRRKRLWLSPVGCLRTAHFHLAIHAEANNLRGISGYNAAQEGHEYRMEQWHKCRGSMDVPSYYS